MKSFAYKRLKYLESLFNMYVLLNDAAEKKEQKGEIYFSAV
jgi:AMP deaminase